MSDWCYGFTNPEELNTYLQNAANDKIVFENLLARLEACRSGRQRSKRRTLKQAWQQSGPLDMLWFLTRLRIIRRAVGAIDSETYRSQRLTQDYEWDGICAATRLVKDRSRALRKLYTYTGEHQ